MSTISNSDSLSLSIATPLNGEKVLGTLYTEKTSYGTEADLLILDIERHREHVEGCISKDLVSGSLRGPCLECPYYPYKDSNSPCDEVYTLQGKLLIDNTHVQFKVSPKYVAKVEALHRVLSALGGISSRTVKIKTKGFTDLSFSINNVIPAMFKGLDNRESESEKGDQT